jgi:hypothetical protein
MMNISIRRQRLLKMWAMNFSIVLLSAITTFVTLIAIVIGLITLGKIYGPSAILGVMAITFLLSIAAALSYAITKEKLEKIEREEERTMNALKTDYSNEKDKLFVDLRSHIKQMQQKMYTSKGSNNVTKI